MPTTTATTHRTTADGSVTFDYSVCDTCGYDAGPNNGWFRFSSCADCRSNADRDANGWNPQNSLS